MTLLLGDPSRVDDPGGPVLTEPDLASLVAGSAEGDEEAFARLYDATAASTFGMLLRISGSTEVATAATRRVYLELWRHASHYRPEQGSVEAWIATIAHRYVVEDVLDLDGDPTEVAKPE